MEVMTVFDERTPETVRRVADSLKQWDYALPLPTDDARCIGFILEQSIALHLGEALQTARSLSAGLPTTQMWA